MPPRSEDRRKAERTKPEAAASLRRCPQPTGARHPLRSAVTLQNTVGAAHAVDAIEYPKWSHLPNISAGNPDVRELAEQAWTALDAVRPRTVFRWGGELARVEQTSSGTAILNPLTFDRLRYVLVRAANWWVKDRLVLPPSRVIDDMLATPDPPLPLLRRVVATPVFSADGRLICAEGYDEPSGIFLGSPPGVSWLTVNPDPSEVEVRDAVSLILDDLWIDFPFVGPSDRAHALALLFLPFVRAFIEGPTPLHLFRKPTTRTGATLLVETIHFIATGRRLNVMTLPEGEEERRRTITAQLAGAPTFIVLDNLRELNSPAISAAITSTRWIDRLIRSSKTLDLSVECGWVGTGNNPMLSDEIAGRCVPCRLDARMERPWERTAFKHESIREWIHEQRLRLVHAVLVLIQHWIAAGRPLGARTVAGFESWSRVVGGILAATSVRGFLEDLRETREAADTGTRGWTQLFAKWATEFGSRAVRTADVYPFVDPEGKEPIDVRLGTGRNGRELTPAGRKMAFGARLAEIEGRLFAGHRLVGVGEFHHARQWRLEPAEPKEDRETAQTLSG